MSDPVNMAHFIAPKSDQLNADDLLGGRSMTITITRVSANPGCAEQPISINFEGDQGKPYKPCKSMRRVLVSLWGSDGSKYIGRRLTLYRDDKVKFGGVEVGGIRISHMSDVAEAVTIALTASKAQRKPFTVKPLASPDAPPSSQEPAGQAFTQKVKDLLGAYETCQTRAEFEIAEKTRAELWAGANETGKKKLKAASDAASKRVTELEATKQSAGAEGGQEEGAGGTEPREGLFNGGTTDDQLDALKR